MEGDGSKYGTVFMAILVIGATGQVGDFIVKLLERQNKHKVVLAARRPDAVTNTNFPVVEMDYDKADTILPALEGIDTVFMMTGYTIDMLRQSKTFIDQAKKSGVKHIVHLGACGPDDAQVAHWGWHQFIERYIEWAGFSYTHLRPEAFMQNLLGYQGEAASNGGILSSYFGGARLSWVDCEDVAAVAVECLTNPETHRNKTYRLGVDAKTYYEIAEIMSSELGRSFRYEAHDPNEFLEMIRNNGLEPAYMQSVYDHYVMHTDDGIPGSDETFPDVEYVLKRKPTMIVDFIQKHRSKLL